MDGRGLPPSKRVCVYIYIHICVYIYKYVCATMCFFLRGGTLLTGGGGVLTAGRELTKQGVVVITRYHTMRF